MKDTRFREPVVKQAVHAFPVEIVPLAASDEDVAPAFGNLGPERRECTKVRWHRVVVEVAADDAPQPFPLCGDRVVRAPTQRLLNLPKLLLHAVPPGFPLHLEFARSGLAADEGEAQEVEGLRLAKPETLTAFRRKAPELDEPGLLGMQRQRKLPQPLAHLIQEAEGLRLAKPETLTAFRRKAPELDEPGLLGMQRQRKLPQPLAHLIQE